MVPIRSLSQVGAPPPGVPLLFFFPARFCFVRSSSEGVVLVRMPRVAAIGVVFVLLRVLSCASGFFTAPTSLSVPRETCYRPRCVRPLHKALGSTMSQHAPRKYARLCTYWCGGVPTHFLCLFASSDSFQISRYSTCAQRYRCTRVFTAIRPRASRTHVMLPLHSPAGVDTSLAE